MPPFGALFGRLFLAEPVGWGMLFGFAVIVLGVVLANGRWRRSARPEPRANPLPERSPT